MNVFGTVNTAQRDQRQVQLVREAVQRAMARPVDARADKDLVRRLSRELRAGEEMVASQVATVRVLAVQQVAQRVRERAVAEGLPPAAAVRLLDLGGIKAVALATRDALERARVRQRQRLSG